MKMIFLLISISVTFVACSNDYRQEAQKIIFSKLFNSAMQDGSVNKFDKKDINAFCECATEILLNKFTNEEVEFIVEAYKKGPFLNMEDHTLNLSYSVQYKMEQFFTSNYLLQYKQVMDQCLKAKAGQNVFF